jgi:serine/threonine-protein kinase
MIGKSIGKYRIVVQLGRSGMGPVYRAIDETLGREVAIKVLKPELQDSEAMNRFIAEATAIAKLNRHEHAVVYKVTKFDGDVLIVMELVHGESLDQLSKRSGPLPPERAAYLMGRVLDALSHAHNAGIVHGDIKPSNVMLTAAGDIKILDFGLSRIAEAARVASAGSVVTAAYLAPEQLMSTGVDARTDLYACGVVFYRLLTGTLPFQAGNPAELMRKQLHEPPTPASAYLPDLPDWCAETLTRALAKAPADRFQTAEEFIGVLRAATDNAAEVGTGEFGAIAFEGGATILRPRSAPEKPPAISSTADAPATTTLPPWPEALEPPPPSEPTAHRPPDVAPLQRTNVMTAAFALIAIVVAAIAYNLGANWARSPAPSANNAQAAANPVTSTPGDTASAPAPAPAPTSGAIAPPAVAAAMPSRKATDPNPPPDRVATSSAPGSVPAAPPSANATPARPSPATRPAFPDLVFEAEAAVLDADKFREREAKVVLADGKISVLHRDNKLIAALAFDSLAGISYSTARHPQWTSPSGPAELLKVEGGAFGIRRSGRNWIALRTSNAVQVIRVRDDDIRNVIAALEARTGRRVDRVAEQKD